MMTQREHVYHLAAAYGVAVEEILSDAGESSANTLLRRIQVARLDDDEAYAGALHELGHLVAPGANLRNGEVRPRTAAEAMGYTLHEELTAWQWAKANALGWNGRMQATMKKFFASYEKGHRDAVTEEIDRVVEASRAQVPYSGAALRAFVRRPTPLAKSGLKTKRSTVDVDKLEKVPQPDLAALIAALFGSDSPFVVVGRA